MDCHRHAGTPAIGVCRHCAKGLCNACATDLGFGLACRDQHEAAVASDNAFVGEWRQWRARSRWHLQLVSIFIGAYGLLSMGYALLSSKGLGSFWMIAGAMFAAMGAIAFWNMRKRRRPA